MNRCAVALLFLATLLTFGCGSPQDKIVGKWKFRMPKTGNAQYDQAIEQMEKEKPEYFTMEFMDNFSWKSATASGRYTITDHQVSLNVLKATTGQSQDMQFLDKMQTIAATLSDDNKTLSLYSSQPNHPVLERVN